MSISAQQKAAVMSYLRAAAASFLTVVLVGDVTFKSLYSAAIAAFVPPVIRWLNPNDAAFGRTDK